MPIFLPHGAGVIHVVNYLFPPSKVLFDHAGNRPIFFSSFDPDICLMLKYVYTGKGDFEIKTLISVSPRVSSIQPEAASLPCLVPHIRRMAEI